MRPRTMQVLSRVQAVREQAARAALLASAREAEEARAAVGALEQECCEVGREFCDASCEIDPRLRFHAERYVDVLWSRCSDLSREAEGLESVHEAARERFTRVLRKSEVIARRLKLQE